MPHVNPKPSALQDYHYFWSSSQSIMPVDRNSGTKGDLSMPQSATSITPSSHTAALPLASSTTAVEISSEASPPRPSTFSVSFLQAPSAKHEGTWDPYNGNSKHKVFSWVFIQRRGKVVHYRCKLCKAEGIVGKGTTNILRHFSTVHHIDIRRDMEYSDCQEKRKNNSAPSPYQTLMKTKHAKLGPMQSKFVDLCAKWIARDGRPLGIVEDEGFKDIVQKLNPRFHNTSRGTVTRRILQGDQAVCTRLRSMLDAVPVVAGTTDAWSDSSGESYCTLTVSFIDSSWTYCSYLIACSPLKGSHTGEALSKFLIKTAKEFGIMQKMVFMSCDNASSAKKQILLTAKDEAVMKDIEVEFSDDIAELKNNRVSIREDVHPKQNRTNELPELLNVPHSDESSGESDGNYFGNAMEAEVDADENEEIFRCFNSVLGKRKAHGEIDPDETSRQPLTATRSVRCTFNRQPCVAHSIQLSVKKALEKSEVRKTISSIRNTCKYFRKSSTGFSFLLQVQRDAGELRPLRLMLDVKTRWGSTAFMIKRFLALSKYVETATANLYKEKVKFKRLQPSVPPTSSDKFALESVFEALTHAEKATAILGAELSPTMHLVDIVLASVCVKLVAVENSTQPGTAANSFSKDVRSLIMARRRRHNKECEMAEHCCHVATLLTPFYKDMSHTYILGKYSVSDEEALKIMHGVANALIPAPQSHVQESIPLNTPPKKFHELLSLGVAKKVPMTALERDNEALMKEFKEYLFTANGELGDCPLQYWKSKQSTLPNLARVARVVFTPTASSTPSERTFSFAGLLRSKSRSRLTPELTEVLLRLGCFLKKHNEFPN